MCRGQLFFMQTVMPQKGYRMKGQNIIIAGVGGQGIVFAGNILGLAAMKQGFDVKKTDTLGMAQRGGSVVSHLRYGEKVFSPSIKKGDVDVIIAFEKLEAARWIEYLKTGGIVFINDLAIPPLSAYLGAGKYPDDTELTSIINKKTDKICILDAGKSAEILGNPRLVNTILLGFTLPSLSIEEVFIKEALTEALSQKVSKLNIKALEKGLELTNS